MTLFLTALFVMSCSVCAQEPPPAAVNVQVLTIRSAIDRALSRNPAVREAREKIAEGEAAKGAAISSSLPQLSAQASALYKKDALNVGNPAFGGDPYNLYDGNAKLTQSIYSGGSLLSGLRFARHDLELRNLTARIAERDLSLQVLQSYYTILLSQRQAENFERTQQVETDVLATAQRRMRIGRGQLLDVLQIKTQMALLVPKIALARNQIRDSAATLAGLLGERQTSDYKLPDRLEAVNASSLAQSPRGALPELARAELARESNQDQKDLAFSTYYPHLDIIGGLGRSSYVKTDLFSSYSTYWSVGLQLNIPIFSGLSSVYQRQQFTSQAAQLEIEEAKVQDDQALAQIRARQNLELSQTVAQSSAEAFRLADASFKEAQRGYRLATIDYLQFLTTQTGFLEAESAYDQAKFDSIIAAAKFCIASGVPLGELITLLETHS